jgi:predicted DNA-binding transcriptional regulator AlpA
VTTLTLTNPSERRRLLSPEEVAARFFPAGTTARWVRDNVRPKIMLTARVAAFDESAVLSWIAQREKAA